MGPLQRSHRTRKKGRVEGKGDLLGVLGYCWDVAGFRVSNSGVARCQLPECWHLWDLMQGHWGAGIMTAIEV